MKFHPQRFWFLAGALFLACSTVQAQKRVDFSKMRDVSNHDQMSLKLRMAKQSDPITKIGPAIGKVEEDPSKRNAERDLIASSTIICFQDALTLVPKRAVLHLPEMKQNSELVRSPLTPRPCSSWRRSWPFLRELSSCQVQPVPVSRRR